MKTKNSKLFLMLIGIVIFTSCNPIQPILVLKPSDFIWLPLIYIILSLSFAKIISIERERFWVWFVLNLILTPLFGLFVILATIFKNKKN